MSNDSLVMWLGAASSIGTATFSLGVATELVADGRTTLADDSLRAMIVSVLDQADRYQDLQTVLLTSYQAHRDRLRAKLPITHLIAVAMAMDSSLMREYYRHLPVAADGAVAFPTDFGTLMRDRDMYIIIDGMFDLASDRVVLRTRMLERIQGLREVVESRLSQH